MYVCSVYVCSSEGEREAVRKRERAEGEKEGRVEEREE